MVILYSFIVSFLVLNLMIHIAPLEENSYNLKNATFQEWGKTTGQGDVIASKEQWHFSPLAAILENRHVTLFQ
jgi:hypothetical protein